MSCPSRHPVPQRGQRSYESLCGRGLGYVPHLHAGSLLLLPAGTVGAVGGAAVERHHQADGCKDQGQEQEHGRKTDGQHQVRV